MNTPKTEITETAKIVGRQLTQPAPPPPTAEELARACAGLMKVAR